MSKRFSYFLLLTWLSCLGLLYPIPDTTLTTATEISKSIQENKRSIESQIGHSPKAHDKITSSDSSPTPEEIFYQFWLQWAFGLCVISIGLISSISSLRASPRRVTFIVLSTFGYWVWRFAEDSAVYSEIAKQIEAGAVGKVIGLVWADSPSTVVATLYFDFALPLLFIWFLFMSWRQLPTEL